MAVKQTRVWPACRTIQGGGCALADVNNVVGAALPWREDDGHEGVAPMYLGGQVGLARHEGITHLCGALKSNHDLRIHLQAAHMAQFCSCTAPAWLHRRLGMIRTGDRQPPQWPQAGSGGSLPTLLQSWTGTTP